VRGGQLKGRGGHAWGPWGARQERGVGGGGAGEAYPHKRRGREWRCEGTRAGVNMGKELAKKESWDDVGAFQRGSVQMREGGRLGEEA